MNSSAGYNESPIFFENCLQLFEAQLLRFLRGQVELKNERSKEGKEKPAEIKNISQNKFHLLLLFFSPRRIPKIHNIFTPILVNFLFPPCVFGSSIFVIYFFLFLIMKILLFRATNSLFFDDSFLKKEKKGKKRSLRL